MCVLIFLQAGSKDGESFTVSKAPLESAAANQDLLAADEIAAAAEEKDMHSFEIDPAQVFFFSDWWNWNPTSFFLVFWSWHHLQM